MMLIQSLQNEIKAIEDAALDEVEVEVRKLRAGALAKVSAQTEPLHTRIAAIQASPFVSLLDHEVDKIKNLWTLLASHLFPEKAASAPPAPAAGPVAGADTVVQALAPAPDPTAPTASGASGLTGQ